MKIFKVWEAERQIRMNAAWKHGRPDGLESNSYNQDQISNHVSGQRACETEGTMAFAQRKAIEASLLQNGGNIALAALQLRIGRSTVYRLMNVYDISYAEITSRRLAESRGVGEERCPR